MIISLCAHGMSVRDIIHHLEQVYGTQLSAETVSRITDGVLEEVRAWQARTLDPAWAVVFLDAIMVKVRDNQVVQNKPAYLAVGIDADGEKHVLGIWLAKTAPQAAAAGEGARLVANPADLVARHRVRQDPARPACLVGHRTPQGTRHNALPKLTEPASQAPWPPCWSALMTICSRSP
jgi:hypothetical protein